MKRTKKDVRKARAESNNPNRIRIPKTQEMRGIDALDDRDYSGCITAMAYDPYTRQQMKNHGITMPAYSVGDLQKWESGTGNFIPSVWANPNPASTNLKADQGKLRWDLLPAEAVEGVIQVLMHGAKKYTDDNWKTGCNYSRYYNAVIRHMKDFWDKRENNDLGSGLSHLNHAICCLIFLQYFLTHSKYQRWDDRPND